ncbi:MAG: T9SS type A sorting domain-containing protein [Bacteroidetes bacterium]|nr:T9SS type A sorting domain-containing protein [Bacteroidota bacterium]
MRKRFTSKAISFLMIVAGLFSGPSVFAQADAGAISIPTPTSPICPGSQNVRAVIQNYGSDTIFSVTVGWKVNGSGQASVTYSDTLLSAAIDTVDLGSFTFLSGNTYDLQAYTADPNGAADADASNDSTLNGGLSVQLSGTYTIGGTSPDFANFADAVTALNSFGVCGPVVFNIRDGIDTTQAVIDEVYGASDINTIVFQSESGDSSAVTLVYPSQPAFTTTNYLIRLNGADYITFRQLTMSRSGIQPYGRVIEFINTATNNTISNCVLEGPANTQTNSLSAIVYSTTSSPTNDSLNTFTYNVIKNGSLGIYMNGINTVSLEHGLNISNNSFVNQYSKGIQMSNQGVLHIEANTFLSSTAYLGYSAIYLDRCQRNQLITKNRISGVPGTGIYMIDCTGLAGVHGIVSNNFIQVSDSACISIINMDYNDIVNNSLNMTGTNSVSTALSVHGAGTGMIVKNNILANTGGGFAYVIADSASFMITASDYNNLYTTGSNVGSFNGASKALLSNWIAAFSKDTHSLSVNPNFLSPSDLHSSSVAMDNHGTPLASVTDDIDGEARNGTTPDIGADEYIGIGHDLLVASILSPVDGACGADSVQVTVIINNIGDNSETHFDIVTEVTGAATTSFTQQYTDTIQSGANDTLTYTFTLNTTAGGVYNFKSYTSLSTDDIHSNDTLNVSIVQLAIPAAPVATGDSICAGGTASLSAVSSDTLQWYDAATGGTLLGTGNPFITPVLNSTTTYYVSAKGNCEGSRSAAVATVLPVPVVSLGNDTAVVLGDSYTFDAGSGFSSYLWTPGNTTTQTFTSDTAGCFTVTVTNTFGCSASDEVCLSIIQPFDVGVSAIITPNDGDCENATAQVEIEVTNYGSNPASVIPVTVELSGMITNTFTDTIQSAIPVGGSVTIVLGTINTLGGGPLNISAYTGYSADLDNNNDTINASDDIIIVPNPPSGLGGQRCGPGPIVISAVGSDTIYWFDAASGGNLLFVGNTFSIPFLSVTTTYYAQTGNVCTGQTRTPVVAAIADLPIVDLGPDVVASDSTTLDAGAGFVLYAWGPNGQTTQTITVTANGVYFVTVQDANGCFNSDTINVTINVGINPVSAVDHVSIFPNPVHNKVSVELSASRSTNVNLEFMDAQGRILKTDMLRNVNGIQQRSYDLTHFAKGVYFMRLSSESGTSMHRFIVD